jgi:hypothetical protein
MQRRSNEVSSKPALIVICPACGGKVATVERFDAALNPIGRAAPQPVPHPMTNTLRRAYLQAQHQRFEGALQ